MAKSKSGGTRGMLRGRVGSDVYSVGRDSLGKKQQVVRSLAETVANPQTISQMRGRMIMSTVMQAVSAMRDIIDHSFDNATGRQGNISEFIRRNYALIKADVEAHPSSGNSFGLNQYQEKGIKQGAYIVSNGSVPAISAITLDGDNGMLTIGLTADTLTVGGLRAALGLTSDEYFTIVCVNNSNVFKYIRLNVKSSLTDDTAISAQNVATLFDEDGNLEVTVSLSENDIRIVAADIAGDSGYIVSKKSNGGYIHSRCVLAVSGAPTYAADVALPTYPVGEEQFLNGGDI